MKQLVVLLAAVAALALCGCGRGEVSDDTRQLLSELDTSLSHRSAYEAARLERIDSLRQVVGTALTDTARYEVLLQLFDEFKSYRYDSAYVYAGRCYVAACQMGSSACESEAKCAQSFCLMSSGMFKEASEKMASVSTEGMSERQLRTYYSTYSKLYQEEANYSGVEPYYTDYTHLSDLYIDTLKTLLSEKDMEWWSQTGAQHMKNRRFDEAIVTLQTCLSRFPDADLHERAMAAAEMAWAYIHTGREDQALDCFIQSAICDNESSTREITALFFVAKLLGQRGDFERASRYATQALDDITFYNARQRKIEIGQILPIIEQGRYNALSMQRNRAFFVAVLIGLLLLFALWSYLYLRRLNAKLWQARQTIAGHNDELRRMNNQLVEANRIKDVYIGRSFFANAEFIEKMERLYKTVDRKLVARQYEDLRRDVRMSGLDQEREQMYAAFDETFLNLFPNFVEEYNKLFSAKDRKQPASEKSLTSEMRIFALIRLGITDSERIARFLDYSVHTVNTYKTRVKNKAIVENESFEQRIMGIS